ncbi:MAG: hypothetical protein FJY85_07180, partial [Deltaproteobacteria bacterium]|nr:hypothetical protein [Deltaproteobacteria bacterium]
SSLKHFVGPIPLSALAASVITAAVTGVWPVVLLGAAAVLVIGCQGYLEEREASAKKARETRPATIESLPDPLKLAPRYRDNFQSLLQKRSEIMSVLHSLANSSVLQQEHICAQVDSLLESYYDLAQKIEKVAPFISSGVIHSIETQISEIERALRDCDDDLRSKNLRMALDNKSDERERVIELRKQRKRIEAQLLNVSTALQSIYVRLVHFSMTPHDADTMISAEITDQVGELIQELQTSENIAREIKAAVEQRRLEPLR